MLFLLIPVLINVAFLTLLERKILGLSQSRKGPNKVSRGGLLQPFADAIKLFTKENFFPALSNKLLYIRGPALALILILIAWSLISWGGPHYDFSLIILLLVLGLGLYPLLLAGWASNRAYALIGALRGVAQTISYEVSLALILIRLFSLLTRLSLAGLADLTREGLWPLVIGLVLVWLITGLAETNRTPFDFAEGESELVSGFNIEYGAGGFALIFIAEYGSILLLRYLTACLLGFRITPTGGGLAAGGLVAFFWVWARATLPRYRYDILIDLAWKAILPAALLVLIFYISL